MRWCYDRYQFLMPLNIVNGVHWHSIYIDYRMLIQHCYVWQIISHDMHTIHVSYVLHQWRHTFKLTFLSWRDFEYLGMCKDNVKPTIKDFQLLKYRIDTFWYSRSLSWYSSSSVSACEMSLAYKGNRQRY